MDLHGALEQLLGNAEPDVPQKVHYSDANYASPGTYPFVCGACKYLNVGTSVDPSEEPDWSEYCQQVHGPYDNGSVDPEDTCRFWKAKEAYLASAPIAHEITGYHVGSNQDAGDNTDNTEQDG